MNRSMRWAFVLIFFSVSVSVYSFDDMDRQIGIIYLKNAAAYYLNKQYTESEKFLEKTSEFHRKSSDYDYLYGLIRLENENNINEAEKFFEQAILNENWILLEKKECVTDLARILFRKKEYKKLIDIVEQEAYPDYRDNDLMYLYLLSLKYAGISQKYESLLQMSIGRYPDDYRFAELYLHQNTSYRDNVLNDKYEYKNPEGALQVLLEAAMTLEESGYKLKALKKYLDRGGKDIGAMIEYYRLRGNLTKDELEKLLDTNIFENPSNRLRLMQILPDLEMREMLADAYSSYTGNIYYDMNNDDFFEELHLYENGKPVGMSIDENQDGLIEVMVIFNGNFPGELILNNDKFIRISYDRYPYLKELSITEGREREVYTFLKDRISLPVYDIRTIDDKILYKADAVEKLLSDSAFLENSSVKISWYTGGELKDNFGYLKEELERRDEMYSILKIYNRLIGNFVYKQYNNLRTAGFGDIDYDNLIDLKENYTDGKIVSIEADDNKNGIYEYKITFETEKTISWWDFNEDGMYDCRQYTENGVLINEYSSKFDGNFDIVERK